MSGNAWDSSSSAAEKLGLKEVDLSDLREHGFFKPGIHWKSSPFGQLKPWNPEAIYNVKSCKKFLKTHNPFKGNTQIAA